MYDDHYHLHEKKYLCTIYNVGWGCKNFWWVMTFQGWLWIFPEAAQNLQVWLTAMFTGWYQSSLYWQTWNHFVQICTHCFSTLSRFDEQWQRIKRIKLSTLVKTSRIISSGIKDLFLQVVCSSTLKRENRTYGRELISGAVTWIFANSFCRESISITWNGRLYSDQG